MVNHNKRNKVAVLPWLVAGYFIFQTMPQVTAKDLGVYGEIFEIAEKDLLDEINAKLKAKSEDGTLAKTQQGQYSEVMIVGPSGYAVGRLLLDPFSHILYSTKAEDYVAVKQYEAQGLSLSDAIAAVAQERHP